MAEANDVYRSIYQNLIDAGCNQQTAKQCMVFAKEDRFTDMLPILVEHRKALLGSLHESQKQIDCLDYLLYKLKNNNRSKEIREWKTKTAEHLKLTLKLK